VKEFELPMESLTFPKTCCESVQQVEGTAVGNYDHNCSPRYVQIPDSTATSLIVLMSELATVVNPVWLSLAIDALHHQLSVAMEISNAVAFARQKQNGRFRASIAEVVNWSHWSQRVEKDL